MSMVGLENLVSGRAAEVNDRKDNDLSAITDRHDLMEDRNKFAFLSLDVGESSNPPDDLTSGLMPVEDGLHDEIVPMDGLDCNSCQMIGFKNQPSKCLICGDKSTGKHYGASSCDGCKGFFRRSIRKANNYVCRWNRNCVIDKDKRNQCRFCRLKKCYQFGMKKEAVQNERDRISYQSRSTPRSHVMQPPISLLHNSVSENSRMRQAASITISDLINSEKSPIVPLVSESCLKPLSSLTELCESMNQQLKALVEWAKTLPAFARLNLDDQVSLLRASAGEQLILGVAKRSLYTKLNSLVLGNNYLLTTNTGLYPEMNSIVSAVMTDIVDPMREIRLEPTEFVLIKAIIFFDPLSRNLKGASKIKSVRRELYTQLENTISHKFPGQNCTTRFAEILALQAPLSKLAFKMKDQLKNSILTGSVRIDKLLNEMLLQEECTYNNNNSPNSTPTVSLISSSNGLKPETSFLGQTSEVPDTFGGHQSTFENNLFPTNDHCQLPWTMKNFDYLASYIETARIPQEIPHPPVQFPGAHLREAVLDQGQPHAMDINHEFHPGGRLWGNQFPVSSSGTLSNGLGPSDESSAGPGATDASLASKTGFSF